ncbi:TPA: hypothetical protein OTZ35_003575 [Enterobacter roggenkampii]|nr:hypothetical protein [Enterobacter roggenkampii]HCT5202459.1 hypothetical protein [Enterobacter roggenkampii]
MTDYTGSNTPADQRDLWRTPPALFVSLDAEFCFQLDAAAAPHNALCRKFITAGRLAFINPVTGKPVSGNNKGSMLIIWRPYPRTHCHFATVDRDELMAFGAKLLARREAA